MTEIDVWTTSPLLNFDHIIEDIRGFGDGLACGCGCGNNGIFGIGYGYMMDTIGNTDDCAFSGYGDAEGAGDEYKSEPYCGYGDGNE